MKQTLQFALGFLAIYGAVVFGSPSGAPLRAEAVGQIAHILALQIGGRNVGMLLAFSGACAGCFILGSLYECWFRDRAVRRLDADNKQRQQIVMRLVSAGRW